MQAVEHLWHVLDKIVHFALGCSGVKVLEVLFSFYAENCRDKLREVFCLSFARFASYLLACTTSFDEGEAARCRCQGGQAGSCHH